jgi:hypothetical protein
LGEHTITVTTTNESPLCDPEMRELVVNCRSGG